MPQWQRQHLIIIIVYDSFFLFQERGDFFFEEDEIEGKKRDEVSVLFEVDFSNKLLS